MSSGAGIRSISGSELEALLLTEWATIADATAVLDKGNAGIAILCDAAGAPKSLVDDAALRTAALRGMSTSDAVSKLPLEAVEILTDAAAKPAGACAIVVKDGKPVEARLAKSSKPTGTFALVLAGGLGSRLGALTETTPKPLIPIAGKPLLDHVLRYLSKQGIVDVTIATNYRAQQIEDFAGCGARYGLRVKYLRESQRMGTAGALSLLDPIPKEPFFIVNADVLTRLDLRAMSRQQQRSGAAIVMAVAPHVVESPYGVAKLAESRVVDLAEKPRYHHWVNAGLYIVEPRVAEAVPRNSFVDMTTMIDKWIQRGEHVEAFPIREYWRDAGTPEDVARANEELR